MAMPWVCIVPKLPLIRLRAQIVGTLDPTDADARRRLNAIDFSLEGFAVSGAKLKGVAAAVGDGRIGVEVGSTGLNFAAAYTAGTNRHFTLGEYNFQPGDNWRSQIVHEAAHAAFDLDKEQPPNEIDEAVAYLGETVWFRAGGLGRVITGRVITAPAAAARIYGAPVSTCGGTRCWIPSPPSTATRATRLIRRPFRPFHGADGGVISSLESPFKRAPSIPA